MKTTNETAEVTPPPRVIRIFGVGGAGVTWLGALDRAEFSGAEFAAVDTDAPSLAASSATVKIHLETKLLRGLGTGGDPERGRALAEEQFSTLKSACAGAGVVLILVGLGGGAGSGIGPVLARAAAEAGALVLAFVTLPFICEGNRRGDQARAGLEQLRAAADGVICLENQKTFKLIDENTSVLDTFQITAGLLVEGVRGVWRLLTRPGLIQVHFNDLCGVLRGHHSESAFAFVETSGPARSREAVEKLLSHPLLDEGRALAASDALLVSLAGGRDLTMAEIGRVMEQIQRHCEGAKIIMGAAIDAGMKNRLSVTLIAAKNGTVPPPAAAAADDRPAAETPEQPSLPEGRAPGATPALSLEQRIRMPLRPARSRPAARMLQTQLPLAVVSRGRFDKSEPTIHKGEDLDIPTYYRRGMVLN
ncbi:MAG: cell division FtsZ family protein [Verrucomicrobia bacterium]|nr:cell division FtsZ family protein [Verrucomicrobiota bacterium]MDE3099356.1 cell division FtsZ family protein [Verrucomicrobiota bacterium]